MTDTAPRIRVLNQIAEISPEDWNRLANPPGLAFDPFLTWEFLDAVEVSEAAAPQTGWTPCHLIAEMADGSAVGAMPLYAKTNSQGEFVFDHSWADALERAGGDYYPKLLCGVPFTPVAGRRLLVERGPQAAQLRRSLLLGAVQLAQQNDLSSLHLNFLCREDADLLEAEGLLIRNDQQFHWTNQDYSTFDDFLAVLSSSKRKNLRKERAKAQAGLEFIHLTGADITEAHWDAFYQFYLDTGARKWGNPYLNRETFSLLGERLGEHLLLIFAMEGTRAIAGALNVIGSETLYGRYWGCVESRPMLHFETCYYQAIDYAISRGLKFVEAGAQGGHKLARGYAPVTTYSAHWIAHPGLRNAIDGFLQQERSAVAREADYLHQRTPFKKDG